MKEVKMKTYDVYAYGMISSSKLYILKTGFPKADHYAEIYSQNKMIGGEAANSAIVLSKLGLKVKIDGNWLSNDEDGKITKEILDNFFINTSRLEFKNEGPCPHEVVFSDLKTRTIFGNYGQLLSKVRRWNIPVKSDIAKSKIVCVDPFFYKQSLMVAQYAKHMHIPYVTVDCQYTDKIFESSSIAVISKEFRSRFYKGSDDNLFKKYLNRSSGLTVFTSGQGKILFGRKGGAIRTHLPPKIKPIDTAGAGDSFRAGIIYGALQGWRDEEMVAFSSALAALVCLRSPGVLNCPGYKEVLNFLKKKK